MIDDRIVDDSKPKPPPPPSTLLGLDLGQAQDFSALAVLQETGLDAEGRKLWSVPFLKRWQLGTSYLDIAQDVAQIAEKLIKPPPIPQVVTKAHMPELAVDATGVGRAVVDIFKQGPLSVRSLISITITGGHSVSDDAAGHKVPKKDLVAAVQGVLQQRRIKVARNLQEAKTLTKELQTFKVKVTSSANETFEAWRERDHDDLVLAVAIAVWLGERKRREFKWW